LSADLVLLDAFEARVLAVLVEKEAITPDVYPMSLNSLVAGCNQLTSRDPVMQLSNGAVEAALAILAEKKLVHTVHQAGARVPKYEHRLRVVHAIERPHAVLLALLMLRGPQTVGELRQRSERMYAFASVDEIDRTLQFMADKFPPLVARLPRAPGTKEPRFAHLLCGEDVLAQSAAASAFAPGADIEVAGAAKLTERIAWLEAEIAALKEELAAFKQRFE